jgi:predicted O-methyltransferase YrrM
MIVRRIARKTTGTIARLAIQLVSQMRSDRLVPIRVVLTMRRLAVGPDPLVPKTRARDSTNVGDEQLARMLEGLELGVWALGPRSLARILDVATRLNPKVILEFGSGMSTLALALALSRGHAKGRRVISLEQDPVHGEATRSLLRRHALEEFATVVVAPLVRKSVEGRLATTYSVSGEFESALGSDPPEMILVDGPSAETGGRFATLPLAHRFTASALFVVDDALRDSELGSAADWATLPYIELAGVEPIEKGLLFGALRA